MCAYFSFFPAAGSLFTSCNLYCRESQKLAPEELFDLKAPDTFPANFIWYQQEDLRLELSLKSIRGSWLLSALPVRAPSAPTSRHSVLQIEYILWKHQAKQFP